MSLLRRHWLALLLLLCWFLPATAITPGEVARAEKSWLEAARVLRLFRFGTEIPDSLIDPAASGLIGSLDGPLTTSLGRLESKQASCQSGWCRVIASLLDSAKVARGDTVALTMTGSFPGLDIAVLMVLQEGGIGWKAVSSYGSSSWGANEIGASWPEMERHLFRLGLLKQRSAWMTPGGPNDRFSSLPLEQVISLELLMKKEPRALHPTSLRQAVELRKRVFGPATKLAAYINVGGGHTAIGSNGFGRLANVGLLGENEVLLAAGLREDDGVEGLLQYYLQKDLPVMHLTHARQMAIDWNLPSTPRQLRSAAGAPQ